MEVIGEVEKVVGMYAHPFFTGLYEQYRNEPSIAASEILKAICGIRKKEEEEVTKVR